MASAHAPARLTVAPQGIHSTPRSYNSFLLGEILMKKIALVVLSACLLHSPLHAEWGQTKYEGMDEGAKRVWERHCHSLLKNTSVKKEPTWIKYLQRQWAKDKEAVNHFLTILDEAYLFSWRDAKRVQLGRLTAIAKGIKEGMTDRQLADLRATLPMPPSWKNKVAALAGLAALGTCVYYLWQDYCSEAEASSKA